MTLNTAGTGMTSKTQPGRGSGSSRPEYRDSNRDLTHFLMLKLPSETRWNSYFTMLQSLKKCNERVIIAQSDPGLDLPARAQLSPHDWDLLDKTLSILKPAFVCTKEAESENCSISDVIPLVKKLNFKLKVLYLGLVHSNLSSNWR